MTSSSEFDWYSNETATFGDRVAAARDALGLTQKELSKKLGISTKTLDGWEHDISEPRANKLQMLSGVLNVSLPWLLTGEGDGIQAPSETPVPAEVSDILTELRVLKGQMMLSAERIAVLEKRLRASLPAAAE